LLLLLLLRPSLLSCAAEQRGGRGRLAGRIAPSGFVLSLDKPFEVLNILHVASNGLLEHGKLLPGSNGRRQRRLSLVGVERRHARALMLMSLVGIVVVLLLVMRRVQALLVNLGRVERGEIRINLPGIYPLLLVEEHEVILRDLELSQRCVIERLLLLSLLLLQLLLLLLLLHAERILMLLLLLLLLLAVVHRVQGRAWHNACRLGHEGGLWHVWRGGEKLMRRLLYKDMRL
jgi:hypothetical protein